MGKIIDAEVKIRLTGGRGDLTDPRWAGDICAHQPLPSRGWGRREGLPNYGIITVRGVDSDAAAARCKRHHTELDGEGQELFTCRASHWINLANLLPAQLEELLSTGRLEMSAAEFYSRCNDRVASLRSVYGN